MKPTDKQYELALTSLRNHLTQVRQESLRATRNGEFMKVAQLTAQAGRLNAEIHRLEREQLYDK